MKSENTINKKTVFISLAIIVIATSTLCIISHLITEKNYSNIPKGQVLLVNHYVNYAWANANCGYIIDSEGNVYSFNFQGELEKYRYLSDVDYIKEYKRLKKTTKPVYTLSKKQVCSIYKYVNKININAKFKKENTAVDAGSDSFKFYHKASGKFITYYTTGNYTGQLEDFNAIKLTILHKSIYKKIIND